jgi:pimeloyl-ACP methyl ester carboxylesterase
MGEVVAPSWLRAKSVGPAARWFWHRQLKKPFFGRFMGRGWRWPADVPEEGWQRVAIESGSHSTLAALLRSPQGRDARGVVVCAHPMGLAAKGFWLRHGHADALLAEGFHVLAFDFNGFGESPSTNFDWPADLMAAGRWARRRFEGLPVHVLGASFGAMMALDALGAEDYPFDRVVAEGCAPTLPMFWKQFPVAHAVLQLGRVVAPSVERKLRPELGMARMPSHVRVMLVHSHGDRWTPVSHGERLAAAAPVGRHIERTVLQRAEHTHGLRDERERYWPAVQAFLAAE